MAQGCLANRRCNVRFNHYSSLEELFLNRFFLSEHFFRILKPLAYSSITRNDESKASDVLSIFGSTGFFSLPPDPPATPDRDK